MRHLVYVTLCRWPSGMQEHMLLHTRRSFTHSDINQVSHWYNNSPDDGHMAAWNMWRIEINIHEKLCIRLVIYKDHARMHSQQNIRWTISSETLGTCPVMSTPQRQDCELGISQTVRFAGIDAFLNAWFMQMI